MNEMDQKPRHQKRSHLDGILLDDAVLDAFDFAAKNLLVLTDRLVVDLVKDPAHDLRSLMPHSHESLRSPLTLTLKWRREKKRSWHERWCPSHRTRGGPAGPVERVLGVWGRGRGARGDWEGGVGGGKR